jgi:hypothetical protein
MTASPPRRRFLPEPVETTARSSTRPNRGNPETQLADRIPDQPFDSPDNPDYGSNHMKPKPATRRALPEPVEVSTKASKKPDQDDKDTNGPDRPENGIRGQLKEKPAEETRDASNKPRRFAPQPVESSTRSSRKFAPEPVETSTRSSRRKKSEVEDEDAAKPTRRRCAPEPVETSTRSNRKKGGEDEEQAEKPEPTRRRFAPEPVETSTRSSRKREGDNREGSDSKPRRKFAPEPVETTVRRRRKHTIEEEPEPTSSDDNTSSRRSTSGIGSPRKFSPELIETARGSYRRGDGSPRVSQSEKDHPTAVPKHLRPPLAPSNSPSLSSEEVPQAQESRFSAASLAKRQQRQHSFLVPDLPCIESDSSEEASRVPSLSTSPSASSEETISRQRKEETRDGQDASFTGYMLSLAAEAAEKQLRDQAMAAYPNEREHEPVQHFAVEDSDEDSSNGKLEGDQGIDPRTFRRESAADLDWHMKEMRRHHAQLEDAKKALKADTAGQSRFSAAALSARHKTHQKGHEGHQNGVGLKEMRNAASPPMLGGDLVFPMSVSPKMTRCDVDQIPVPRTYEKEDEEETGEPKLWCANISVRDTSAAGLWMGFCQRKEGDTQTPPTPLRSGIMTPNVEIDNAEGALGSQYGTATDNLDHNLLHLPPTPSSPRNDPFTESIDNKLNQELCIEQKIEEEFHNSFITQIYNYLSLGYPSLAHKFDPELSKISLIPVEELRKDDDMVDAKGYVGAPEGHGVDEDSVKDGKCARWTALRFYIHEWARQQPGMADRTPGEWGVRARRGSWAF